MISSIPYRQYLSHIDRNRGWPPMSQSLIVTLPLEIFRILNPTVGIMSSLKLPEAITLTKVVLPACCRPTRVSSISSFQNRDLNHSSNLFIIANILEVFPLYKTHTLKSCQDLSSLAVAKITVSLNSQF